MDCPYCGSPTAKTCAATYSENTTISYSETSSSGVTFELGKLPSIGRGKSKCISVSQTKLAELAAPPEKPPENLSGRLGLILGIPLFIAYAVNSQNFSRNWFVFILLLIAIPLVLLDSLAEGKKEDAYAALKWDWDRSWICSTCLRKWIQKDGGCV